MADSFVKAKKRLKLLTKFGLIKDEKGYFLAQESSLEDGSLYQITKRITKKDGYFLESYRHSFKELIWWIKFLRDPDSHVELDMFADLSKKFGLSYSEDKEFQENIDG